MEIKSFTKDIDNFLDSLEKMTRNKITQLFDMLEIFGGEIDMPYSKSLGNGLFELRVSGKISVRIIYCFYEGYAILLHAFVKKTEKIAKKELDLAKKRKNLLA
jgi:phage-related protein